MDTQATPQRIADLESALNNFNADIRAAALRELIALAEQGVVTLEPEREIANLHCHTFFSFNAYGYSPSGLAWLAKRRGYKLLGSVDFDVLDAVDEFLNACERAGVRGSAGIETRVFIQEYADQEINSPGEPGVCYHMGVGFTSSVVPNGAKGILNDLRQRANQRNRALVERINSYLAPASIDYDAEVMPLSPGGNPTERHIVTAYIRAAEQRAPNLKAFWADKLGMTVEQVEGILGDTAKIQNTVRSKLMKKGGVGYVQPGWDTFPAIEPFHELIEACGALPCAAWLDGTSGGEKDMPALLDLFIRKGVVALNIVPDRNWNIPDPDKRKLLVGKLYEVVDLARDLSLPLNVGTEMNSYGNKLIDDFDVPEVAPVRQAFIDGAYFVYGHTAMQRKFGMGYQSAWAKAALPIRQERNAFYTKVGYALQPGHTSAALTATMSPADILTRLQV